MAYYERQGELDALRRERQNIRDELEDLDVLINKINAEETRLSEGLDTTLANLRAKLDRLPPNSLLRERHYSSIKSYIQGRNSDSLFLETDNGIATARKKKRNLEQRLSVVKERIATLEAEAMSMEEIENG